MPNKSTSGANLTMATDVFRAGYNLLYMDSDTILFDDPYQYFKAPPFNHINLLNMPENPCGTHDAPYSTMEDCITQTVIPPSITPQ